MFMPPGFCPSQQIHRRVSGRRVYDLVNQDLVDGENTVLFFKSTSNLAGNKFNSAQLSVLQVRFEAMGQLRLSKQFWMTSFPSFIFILVAKLNLSRIIS